MHKLGTDLKLRSVDYQSSADCGFLFGVLLERLKQPDSNISHRTMPSWDQHLNYLRNGTYPVHYLAVLGNRGDFCIGHSYIDRDDHVGLYVQQGFRRHGVGSWMLAELTARHPRSLTANIAPKNTASLQLFRNGGFLTEVSRTPVQVTLRLEPPCHTHSA